jgi:uncharacterized membrane protein YhaH (DUF805 family)
MAQIDELRDYLKRPRLYANIDGTAEMSMGLMVLAFYLMHCLERMNYLDHVLPATWPQTKAFKGMLLLVLLVIPMLLAGRWATKSIKKHITYPRTGYVVQRKAGKSTVVVLLVVALLSAGFAALSAFAYRRYDAAAMSLIWAAVMAGSYSAFVFRLSREHLWKLIIAALMSAGLLLLAITQGGSSADFMGPAMLLVALSWLASGALTLAIYVKRTHSAACEAE